MNNATCPLISYWDETRLDIVGDCFFKVLMAETALIPATDEEADHILEAIEISLDHLTKKFDVTVAWIYCLVAQERNEGVVGILEADGSVRLMRDDESYTVEAFAN